GPLAAAQTNVDRARVEHVLERAVVVDVHDDTPQMIVDEGYNAANLRSSHPANARTPRLPARLFEACSLSARPAYSDAPCDEVRRKPARQCAPTQHDRRCSKLVTKR